MLGSEACMSISVFCLVLRSHGIDYRKISNIRRTKFQNLNDSRLVLHLSLPNLLKPGVKQRMKMQLEQRRQALLQLHLSDQQHNCLQRCVLYCTWRYISQEDPCLAWGEILSTCTRLVIVFNGKLFQLYATFQSQQTIEITCIYLCFLGTLLLTWISFNPCHGWVITSLVICVPEVLIHSQTSMV